MDEQQKAAVLTFIKNKEQADFIISNYELAHIVEWPRKMDYPFEFLVVCTPDGKRGVYDSNGDLIVPCNYYSIEPVAYDGLTEFSQGGIYSKDRKFAYGNVLEKFHNSCDLELVSQDSNLKIFYKDSEYVYF